MKPPRHPELGRRSRAREGGFMSVLNVEFLAIVVFTLSFLAIFLPTYAAVRKIGGSILLATTAGVAGGLISDIALVAIPCLLLRLLVWRDGRRRRRVA